MNPLKKSLCIFPAALLAFVSFSTVQALDSFFPAVKKVIKFKSLYPDSVNLFKPD